MLPRMRSRASMILPSGSATW